MSNGWTWSAFMHNSSKRTAAEVWPTTVPLYRSDPDMYDTEAHFNNDTD
jgi:hypothetical protein